MTEDQMKQLKERMMMMTRGIDVSKWQKGIDFNLAKKHGYNFCIVRAGRTGSNGRPIMDELFYKNINGAKGAGMDIGIYFYSKATDVDTAHREAEWINHLLKTDLRGVELSAGIWIDVEDDSMKKLNANELTGVIMAIINRLNSYGIYVGIYSSFNFFTRHLNLKAIPKYVPLWVAQYGKENRLKKLYPDKYIPVWQYSENGKVGNVSVDLDIWY